MWIGLFVSAPETVSFRRHSPGRGVGDFAVQGTADAALAHCPEQMRPRFAFRFAIAFENKGNMIVTVFASAGERYLSTPLFQLINHAGHRGPNRGRGRKMEA